MTYIWKLLSFHACVKPRPFTPTISPPSKVRLAGGREGSGHSQRVDLALILTIPHPQMTAARVIVLAALVALAAAQSDLVKVDDEVRGWANANMCEGAAGGGQGSCANPTCAGRYSSNLAQL